MGKRQTKTNSYEISTQAAPDDTCDVEPLRRSVDFVEGSIVALNGPDRKVEIVSPEFRNVRNLTKGQKFMAKVASETACEMEDDSVPENVVFDKAEKVEAIQIGFQILTILNPRLTNPPAIGVLPDALRGVQLEIQRSGLNFSCHPNRETAFTLHVLWH